MMKPFTAIAVVLLALIAFGHLLRVLAGWELVIGAIVFPMWPSVLAVLGVASLSGHLPVTRFISACRRS
jgi:hypothetical protein